MKNPLAAIFLIFVIFSPLLSRTAVYTVQPPNVQYTLVSGRGWAYRVLGEVKNAGIIQKLIACESQGVNIARPDSNGLTSWGVGQFNGTSTWAQFSRQSGIVGSPMNPSDAIRMMDWAIEHGYLHRWTCAAILHL